MNGSTDHRKPNDLDGKIRSQNIGNSKDRIIEWRKDWEITVNKELERIGSDERIDSRSFMDQGREQELPTIHMGVAASNIEKRAAREALEGIPSEKIKHSDIGTLQF